MHNETGIGGLFFVIVLGGALVTVTIKNILKWMLPKKQADSVQQAFDSITAMRGGRRGMR